MQISSRITFVTLLTSFVCFNVCSVISAQTEQARADTLRMSSLMSDQTGIVTVAAVLPRGNVHDIDVRFNGPVTNYKGVMGVLVGAVGETTRRENYVTEWCYINTRKHGRERILTRDVRQTQSLVLAGKVDEAWNYFLSKKVAIK
jgi:hypothetical protein